MAKFYVLGGGNEIGASCYFIELDGTKFLLDCGIRPSSKKTYPDFINFLSQGYVDGFWDIDAILLSHSHLDHIGALPSISQDLKNNIYISSENSELFPCMLSQTLKNNSDSENIKLYSENQVKKTLEKVNFIDFNKSFFINDIKITFYPAGHILGASCILLESKEGNFLYTGDFSYDFQYTVPSIDLPKGVKIDTLISENTYGDIEIKKSKDDLIMDFINEINASLKNEHNIIIPAFALGRTQEIAMILNDYIERGLVLNNPEIFIDGLSQKISHIYENKGFKIYSNYIKNAPRNLYKNIKHLKSKIVICSSGMLLEGSASYKYYKNIRDLESAKVIFTGYLDPLSYGNKVYKNKDFEKSIIVKHGLSAHTDSKGIFDLIKHTNPKRIIYVHTGDNSSNILFKTHKLFPKTDTIMSFNNMKLII
ncbi:MAG: uncharacterized protein PWP28_2643 [Oceanotoga sp.]|jgi:Cft2 family RNA processing exonuclease|uniref:MBL fold metallo-hydrolase n=1 Tax=Oceanotoga sp. TaxID=2108366 RepID=UPI002652C90C|nr:MBL fold metallo-hydrolase [Oceanotoga sp.]MDN5343763.1 uncharacterized protein [Oceanotoga sp.]